MSIPDDTNPDATGAEVGRFVVDARDDATSARASRLATAHGEVELPAFFPVATRAALKMCTLDVARDLGSPGLLMNAFHLHLKPGEDAVVEMGGLHGFAGWDRPIVTDSGGFQVFSLPDLRTVTDDGVTFASPIDGSVHEFTPEGVVDIQRKLGSDVMISLDECVKYPSSPAVIEAATRRTIDWNRRSAARWREGGGEGQLLFGVVQGGTSEKLRIECVSALAEIGLPGYAIGGISVGEGPALIREVLAYTIPACPEDRPRYVMGLGPPEDVVDAIAMGADLFDCVMPTRNARGACAFTRDGKVRLRNAAHARSRIPVEPGCDCPCCTRVSRGYLRHLFIVGEAAAAILVTMHNLRFYSRLMQEASEAILARRFGEFRRDFLARYSGG
ncbi:MAG: tRNA guanosine(34) transglycosylase Tgt [Planctomycetota bacterium]|jgi:queuine tRNA-ribosyltransferase